MVRDPAPFLGWSFGGSDVEVAVNLERIAIDDLPAVLRTDAESEVAFAGSGRPDDCYQGKIAHCFQCIGREAQPEIKARVILNVGDSATRPGVAERLHEPISKSHHSFLVRSSAMEPAGGLLPGDRLRASAR